MDKEHILQNLEEAIVASKDLIREKHPVKTRFNPHNNEFIIGYGRDLANNPLDAEELFELIEHGFEYPFTGEIRVTYAEYLLHKEIIEATNLAIKTIGGIVFHSISVKRQQFLIHIAHDLKFTGFYKMKQFIKHVREMDWELATSQLLSYQSPMGQKALLED